MITPMSRQLSQENSDRIKLWSKYTLESRKLVKPALFSVLTIDSEWMIKGYINSSGIIEFNNEHDAINYIDRWYQRHKGYAKFITPK